MAPLAPRIRGLASSLLSRSAVPLTTATRAGACPRRGKLNQKHYTVYVAKLSPQVRESYVPTLNEEHRQWRWFPLGEAAVRPDLHPVVGKLLVMHRKELGSILAASSARAP